MPPVFSKLGSDICVCVVLRGSRHGVGHPAAIGKGRGAAAPEAGLLPAARPDLAGQAAKDGLGLECK